MNTQQVIEALVRSHVDLSRRGPRVFDVFLLPTFYKPLRGLENRPALEAAAIIRLRTRVRAAHTQ